MISWPADSASGVETSKLCKHAASCYWARIVASKFYAIFISTFNYSDCYQLLITKKLMQQLYLLVYLILCCCCSKNLLRSQTTAASWVFFLAVLIAAICNPVLAVASNSSWNIFCLHPIPCYTCCFSTCWAADRSVGNQSVMWNSWSLFTPRLPKNTLIYWLSYPYRGKMHCVHTLMESFCSVLLQSGAGEWARGSYAFSGNLFDFLGLKNKPSFKEIFPQ